MTNINICLSCDDNYAKHAGVAIASILVNASKNDELNFYILNSGISTPNKEKISLLSSIKKCNINFIEVNKNLFKAYRAIKTHSYISIPAYYRLKLASLLPEVKRIIYFDCDIVVNTSLKALFESDLKGNPLGAVRDINRKMLKKNPSYINSGMLVMDLDTIREKQIEELLLQWTINNADSITMGDQEIINRACIGQITLLDDGWNVQSSNFINRSSYTKNPKVVHYIAKNKPWHWASFSYHRELYFRYLQLTPWRLDKKEYKHWTIDNQRASLIKYLLRRPTFFLRPRFYEALVKTYLIQGDI